MKIDLWSPGFGGFGGGITMFSRELALALHVKENDLELLGKADSRGTWNELPLRGAGS